MKKSFIIGSCVLAAVMLFYCGKEIWQAQTQVENQKEKEIEYSKQPRYLTCKQNITIDGHHYEEIQYIKVGKTGKMCILAATTKEKDLVIPSEIEGKPVEMLGKKVWTSFDSVTLLRWNISAEQKYGRIVVPETVTELGEECFSSAKANVLELPKSLKKVGRLEDEYTTCFTNAEIDTVVIQGKKTDIPGFAFAHSQIRTVVFPKKYEGKMEENAFAESGIETFTWPSYKSGASKKIGHSLFENCKKLKKVVFPKNQAHIYIPESTFYGCTKLKKLTFPASTQKVTYRWHAYADNFKMGPQTLEFKGKKTKLMGTKFEYKKNSKPLLTVGKIIVPPKSKALAYAKKAKKIKSFSKYTIKERIQDHEGPETNYADETGDGVLKLTKLKYVIRK